MPGMGLESSGSSPPLHLVQLKSGILPLTVLLDVSGDGMLRMKAWN